ncbi:branched-chain amino acid ABC transporter permease [Thermosipho atlanticus]|uniref:Amino acid/amide ABC transporter membrane protein 2, HAAT family n=1 Tax=Thermosipho atlanticus DSM 15807 TaxID=1123380 RepID=A0A1M5QSE6_9BACT|nr:branched-chain amino acid ABC transporter permease [Thermosipho atlanticus]SHH16878.1 amino acid/amide ABC transporter membrane protein 2, HAAT family [Thermosipho atlanticus DSM 15807]
MEKLSPKTTAILTILTILVFMFLLLIATKTLDSYRLRIINLMAIYAIMAVSLNLINGITGILSLGHSGFILIGAYTSALLTLTPEQKLISFIIEPVNPLIQNLHTNFFIATLAGGVVAAIFAFFIGWPVLKLSGDYLAIASLGFAEVIRIIALNAQSVTNGALGLKGIPEYTNTWWAWGWLLITVVFIVSLVKSSYGRALLAIREDRVAAEAMGINVFKHELMSFIIGAFFAGISGALYAHWLTTIDPKITTLGPILTFYILIMIVLGGLGSITGSVVGGVMFALLMEWLRNLEDPFTLFGLSFPNGIKGLRLLVISTIFILTMIFWNRGIFGRNELTWNSIYRFFKKRGVKK